MGSGTEAHAATSRFGEGSQRNEYLREAEHRFIAGDSVGRDLISGNKIIYNLAAQVPRPGLLSRRLMIDPVIHAFSAPPEFDDLRSSFGKERVIIIRGPAGSGKQATGVRLLYELCSGALFQLSKVSDIPGLHQWLDPEQAESSHLYHGAGFLLPQPRDFADLASTVLQGLDEALTRADARLVITINADVPVADGDLAGFAAEISGFRDYQPILARRLEYRLGARRCAALLAREDLRDLIIEHLRAAPSAKNAADTAEAIAEWADSAENDDDRAVAKIRFGAAPPRPADFEEWFSGLGDTATRSFAIALAVLDGLPYDAVARAARALAAKFDRPAYLVMAGADRPGELDAPFGSSRAQWLGRLRARAKTVPLHGPYGRSYADIIEYKDESVSVKVLRRAWSDYQAQPKLLAWLGELARDEVSQVRINAGLTLGQLARGSFDYLAATTFVPWARSESTDQREAVAYALRVVTADPALRETALSLISGWYGDRDSAAAQATAARAYGLAYGHPDADGTLGKLHRLASVGDIRVAIAIGDSISDLLISCGQEFACTALDLLAASLTDRERNSPVQLSFLIAAATLVADIERGEGAEPRASWPYLLWLTANAPKARAPIISLWRGVLHDKRFYAEAEDVISRWAKAAESEPQVRETFMRLARAVAMGDDRARAALVRYAAAWSSRDNLSPLPVVAAEMQRILGAEREP